MTHGVKDLHPWTWAQHFRDICCNNTNFTEAWAANLKTAALLPLNSKCSQRVEWIRLGMRAAPPKVGWAASPLARAKKKCSPAPFGEGPSWTRCRVWHCFVCHSWCPRWTWLAVITNYLTKSTVIYVWECVPLHNKTDPVNYGRPVMSMIQPSYLLYNRSLRCGGRSTFVERGCDRDGGLGGRTAFYQGVPAKCQLSIAGLSCCCAHHDQEREALCQDWHGEQTPTSKISKGVPDGAEPQMGSCRHRRTTDYDLIFSLLWNSIGLWASNQTVMGGEGFFLFYKSKPAQSFFTVRRKIQFVNLWRSHTGFFCPV